MQFKATIGILIYIGLSTTALVRSLPQKNVEQKPPASPPQKEDEVRPGEGEAKFDIFDWHLAKITGLTNTEVENVVTSPISLKLVLATLFDGANSTTAEEIARAMGFDKDNREYLRKSYNKVLKSLRTSSPHLISDVETRIFAHHTASLKKPFLDVLKNNYGTDIEKVDFGQISKTIKKMNDWAEGVTHGHIKDLISEGDADKNAVMLLLNVIFFNGLWKLPFAENETKIEQFYLNDRQYVNAAMMKAQHSLDYVESFDFNIQIVRLPYRDGTFAMYIVLPRSRSGINDLIANVTPERVHTLMRGMAPTNVELSIPKFDFSYSVGLKPVLRSLGIEQMFSTAADFSNMEENSSLFVSNVIQKAGIEINEKGSTAYASTVVEIHNKYGGSEEDKVHFNANRPFLFFIEEDKTRTVLFVGKMTNPSSDTPPAPALPPSFEVNQQTPLFLQGGIPSDRDGDVYPSEIERMSFFDAEILDDICDKTEGNVVISPASIKSVLGLLLNGATGKSASEIQQTLRLPENQDSAKEQIQYVHNTMKNASSNGVTLESANALFVAKDLKLKDDYKQNAKTYYQAPVLTVDFKYPATTVRTINNWANESTKGAIPSIVKAGMLKPESSLVIVNAIYFKANWLTRFEQAETSVRPFHKTVNQIMYTPMMHATNSLKHSYVPSLQAQVLQIPYQDNKHHMVIVLPKKKDGINEVARDMKHNTLLRVLAQQETSEVVLQLPRFIIEFDTDIAQGLQDLRTREIFSDKAHLQNIAEGNKKLKVDAIVHKARIEVNEKGTYAAAVTEAGLVPLSTPQQVTFTADHPFLFYIYNSQTGVFLFEGRLTHPEESTKAQYDQSLKKADNKNTILDRTKPQQFDIRTPTDQQSKVPSNQNNIFPTNTPPRLPVNQNTGNNQLPANQNNIFPPNPPPRLPANQNTGNNRLPANQNVPNVLQSEPSQQPPIVVTQRSTSINPGGNNYNYQLPQKNVVVTQQTTNGQPQTTNFQSTQKQTHVYTQPGLIPGTSQQIFYTSSSSSASSSHTSTSSESKNTHTSSFSFTRYPNGVNGPYQTTNSSDMQAIRFQI